jgi:hypothetical protein
LPPPFIIVFLAAPFAAVLPEVLDAPFDAVLPAPLEAVLPPVLPEDLLAPLAAVLPPPFDAVLRPAALEPVRPPAALLLALPLLDVVLLLVPRPDDLLAVARPLDLDAVLDAPFEAAPPLADDPLRLADFPAAPLDEALEAALLPVDFFAALLDDFEVAIINGF